MGKFKVEQERQMGRFKVENETVLDDKTNLMWMQKPLDGTFTFDEAIKLNREFAGFSDWRMPTIDELSSIMNYQTHQARSKEFVFTDEGNWFWSSSLYKDDIRDAWGVYYYDGFAVDHIPRTETFPIRLVRDCTSEEK